MRLCTGVILALIVSTPASAVRIRWVDTAGFELLGGPVALDAAGNVLLPQYDDTVRVVAPDGAGSGFGEPERDCESRDILAGADDTVYLACYQGVLAYGPPPGREKTLVTPAWDAREIREPTALARGPLGELWIAGLNGVFRWDGPGTSATAMAENAALDIAIAGDGDVHFSDGETLWRLAAGGGPPELRVGPTGAGLDARLSGATRVAQGIAGEVYVAGWLSHNVLRVDPSGAVSEVIDARGDGEGVPFFGASGIAADGAGGFVVSSSDSDAVFRIAADGAVSVLIDETGDGVNGLGSPGPVAVDATGAVWVSASGGLFRVTPDGSITRLFHANSVPGMWGAGITAITMHPIGVAVVADSHDKILAIAPSGAYSVISDDANAPGSFDAAELAYDLQGRLVVAGNAGLLRREFDGSWTTLIDNAWIGGLGVSGIAVGPTGDVFTIARASRSLYRVAPDNVRTEILLPLVFGSADNDLVAHPDGTLSLLGNGRVWRLWPNGVENIRWDVPRGERLRVMALDPSGRIGLAGTGVFSLEPSNQATQHLDETGIGSGQRMGNPIDLAIGLDGSLYVAAERTDNVFRVTPRGEIQLVLDREGAGAGHELWTPARLAVGPGGDVYVSHWGPGLFRIAPPSCGDGRDNDVDGLVDRADPDCASGDNERPGPAACGLGGELMLLLPALAAARAGVRRERLPSGQ
jgi:sugar lactone lactonase YvrE